MKKYSFFILFLFSGSFLFGQRTIVGSITDGRGALIGATILVKDGRIGTISDIDGTYSLEIPKDTKILIFSYTGYATKEVKIKGRDTISVKLDEPGCRLGWSPQKDAYGQGATTIKFNWDSSKTVTNYTPKKGRY